MRKYISTFVLIVIVVLLVAGIGYCCKQNIQKDKEIAVLQQQNEDLNATIKDLNTKIESMQNEKTPQTEDKKDDEKEEKNESVVPVLDTQKISNLPENSEVVENIYDNNGVLSISVDNENNSLDIILDGQLARQIYGYSGQTETHTIAGISEKIVDAKIVSTGKDSSGVKVVMLLESGTVKYIDIANILDKTYTVKTIDVEDIVRISEVSITSNDNSDTYGAVVGIKNDGTSVILSFN